MEDEKEATVPIEAIFSKIKLHEFVLDTGEDGRFDSVIIVIDRENLTRYLFRRSISASNFFTRVIYIG